MQRTRITVKLLVCVAVTTLSGCVSVTPQPDVPPRPRNSSPARDLAPQIARPPVHDSLEAVPVPAPSAAASTPAGAPPDTGRAAARTPRQRNSPGAARPRHAPPAVTAPVPALPAPVAGTDVCALGRGYGHWPAGSPQSRICENTYGR
ncbi:hypothetical protein [Streptomyces sp. NBC_01618]|uniref:hypothetical protein n=1 Tax=Streptomyces sp. NBC_01618 TaxID=2975900 RepID=UPI00386DF849|nr:hypothetical protein OH735_05095 [Streptomyces sp. NBC_01618]